MNFRIMGAGLALTLALPLSAHAQVTIDASKITCDQFIHGKVGPTRSVGLWLSGFYYGKSDNRLFDPQNFEANLGRLERFCYQEKNFTIPVMQALEQIAGQKK